jgi:hypothetical protein
MIPLLGGDVMTHPAPTRKARLRPIADLIRERDYRAPGARREAGFDRGAYDALSWLVEGGPGPLTGELVGLPIPAAVIVHELATAEAVLSTAPGRCHKYAAGILEAMMWAQRATPTLPRAEVPMSTSSLCPPSRITPPVVPGHG